MKRAIFGLLATTLIFCSCSNRNNKMDINANTLSIMKVTAIEYGDKFSVELNLEDTRITKFETSNLNKIDYLLPKSFQDFINNISDGLILDIGNQLTIFSTKKTNGLWTTIAEITAEYISITKSDKFVVFGVNGVDSEGWAFYTSTRFADGEYPIVWITQGAADDENYVLMNSRFDRFLTIQSYLLTSGDYEKTMSYSEALAQSEDKNQMNAIENGYQELIDKLYESYDPLIPTPKYNQYTQTMTIDELNVLIEKINKNAL
jgi:hypothetical protein